MRQNCVSATWAICVALLAVLTSGEGRAETGVPLSIQGTLTIRVFSNEKEIRKSTREFTVVRLPGEWLISTSFPTNIASIENTTVYSDHGDTYSVHSFNTDKITNRVSAPTNSSLAVKSKEAQQLVADANLKKVKNDQEINVHHQPFPPRDHSYSFFPWLAYCSDYYLNGDSKKYIPLPWVSPFETDDANVNRTKVSATLTKSSPYILDRVIYFNVGMVPVVSAAPMSSSNQISNGSTKWKPAPHPFDKGFTNAIFATSEATNIAGLMLPMRFDMVREEPRARGDNSGARLFKTVSIEGVVTNIAVGAVLATKPGLSRSLIYDFRLREKQQLKTSVRYLSTNGNILTESQVRRLPAAKKEFAEARHKLVKASVAVVLFLGMTILLYASYRRKSKTNISVQ